MTTLAPTNNTLPEMENNSAYSAQQWIQDICTGILFYKVKQGTKPTFKEQYFEVLWSKYLELSNW